MPTDDQIHPVYLFWSFHEEQLTRNWEAQRGGWDEYPSSSATSWKNKKGQVSSSSKRLPMLCLLDQQRDFGITKSAWLSNML